jgi:prepilin-type processing-associated H-X9-DG protein
LIELLTVIAIIGILAAIIIPTVGAVRTKAQGARCTSNLRQIGVGVRLFANDNKGMMVPWRAEPNEYDSVKQGILWTENLVPYMGIKRRTGDIGIPEYAGEDYRKDSRSFHVCPASPVSVVWGSWGNYAIHPIIMKATLPRPANFSIDKVKRPSQVIIVADGSVNEAETLAADIGGGSCSTGGGQYFDKTYPNPVDSPLPLNLAVSAEANNPNLDGKANMGYIRYRHNNTANALCLDGHVKRITYANRQTELTYANFVYKR